MALKEIITHDDRKYALVGENEHPLYEVEGKDIEYDGEKLAADIRQVNAERDEERTALESLKAELENSKKDSEKYSGIDPEEAKKAIETVKNFDQAKMVEAGEVEKIKQSAIEAIRDSHSTEIAELKNRFEPIEAERDTLKAQLDKVIISNAFANSKFIEEKVSVPSTMIESVFSGHVKVQNGKLKVMDSSGKEIYSRKEPNRPADFDEALELVIEAYPHKATILKGAGRSGTGLVNGEGVDMLGDRLIARKDAEEMSTGNPKELARLMSEGYRVVDQN